MYSVYTIVLTHFQVITLHRILALYSYFLSLNIIHFYALIALAVNCNKSIIHVKICLHLHVYVYCVIGL